MDALQPIVNKTFPSEAPKATEKARFKLSPGHRKLFQASMTLSAVEQCTKRGMTIDRRALDANCKGIARWATSDDTKQSLIMTGFPGTGKTTMLDAMAATFRQLRVPFHRFNATDLPDIMLDFSELFRDRILRGSWTDYLLLDDIGEEPAYVMDYGRQLPLFSKIVAERYERMLPIVITTNLTPDQIRIVYGERTADRLREVADILTFKGSSYR